jgi:type II secretory pathway pseudopilin PulG
MKTPTTDRRSESGMTLFAILAIMAVTAIVVLSAAPLVQQEVQRELELESIRRGEEVADAIRQYYAFYNNTKLPESIDDLLEGLPQGTKKRMILRPSAAIDPLSEDGKWRLIKAEPQTIANIAKRVQLYNGGLLPSSPPGYDRYLVSLVNVLDTDDETDITEPDEDIDLVTDSQPFIGVASQSKSRSVLAYYGVENHSKWVYTPLFRGGGNQPGGGPGNGNGSGLGSGSGSGGPIRRPILR